MPYPLIKTAVGVFILGLTFGSGLCIASCGPILISYIAGAKKDILKSFIAYSLFSLARVSVYIVLSLLLFFLGRFIVGNFMSSFSKYILILGGAFIVLVGILTALGKSWKCDKQNIVIMGVVIGMLPCAPLIATLSYITLISKTWAHSLLYSVSFGLGTFLSPLIVLVVLTGFIPEFMKNRQDLIGRIFGYICGFIIIFLGVQMIGKAF